ncbi:MULTISPECIES: carbamoyltransferase C-terminal domain-containing protein [Actinosynnema]|uniref:carbamoyltransferase family protein n=1 Tax=Actinosynnema TaxID=40566 RepID=UPI0020A35205|nr:carbamoyltransferase C-terminal domain-containing protein [Actinosynnema pretiosum]
MIVLGISGGLGHDAAAGLVIDGEVVACAEEERFVRRKHAYGLTPANAAMYCLDYAGITMADIDCLAVSWDPRHRHPDWPTTLHERLLGHPFFAGSPRPAVQVVGHARAHAAAAFSCSGFTDAAVLTVDGQGDAVSTTLGRGSGTELTADASFGIRDSLGFFYLALTNYLGFELGEEGKVMGLASYTTPTSTPNPFELTGDGYRSPLDVAAADSDHDTYRAVVGGWKQWFTDRFGPPAIPTYRVDPIRGRARVDLTLAPHHYEAAAAGQAELERVLLHLVELAVAGTGVRDLVIGGGVGLNCTANGVVERSGLVDRLYVFPASGDAGTGLGAALAVAAENGERPKAAIETAAFGPEFADADIAALLHELDLPSCEATDVAADTAALLDRGMVVGWVQGRMEIGPRALGNRSILALPRERRVHTAVNNIKGREQWRPLAPSILAADADRYVTAAGRAPFMLTACQVTDRAREEVPAVVHVDGSCRPQLVREETNACYAGLLDAVTAATGTPVVLNTSFNQAGEPLVCGPHDAIRSFFASGLDALVMGNSIVTKRPT